MTSQSLIRMNQDVPGHTPQAPAHPLSVPPAHACPARLAQTSSSGLGHPSRPMVLREGVRPQDPRAHLCDPSLSCPSHARRVPPHLGHASGSPPALPGPSGTCARRSPMSLLLSSTPSLLAPRGIMSSIPRLPSTCLLADNIVAETRGVVMPTVV